MRLQLDLLEPTEPLPIGEGAERRMQEGIAFEAEIVRELRDGATADWVFLDEDDAVERTLDALRRRVPVIVGPSLPSDEVTKRSGKPDLLVLHEDGYLPVDVKHHLTQEPSAKGSLEVSTLREPFASSAWTSLGGRVRKHRGDALQLAHYRRMLESLGHAASSTLAGIIGKERVVTWYDLDAPLWQTPSQSSPSGKTRRSSLELYDLEFDLRCDVAAVVQRHQRDPSVALLAEPVKIAECDECPWRAYCGTSLERADDPSLLRGVGIRGWRSLRDHGLDERAEIAGLDLFTARLLDRKVDLKRLLRVIESAPDDAARLEVVFQDAAQREVLAEAGVATVADVRRLVDPRTAKVEFSRLARTILDARAAVGPEPIYRLPDATAVEVPRGDLELDIDMESTDDGAYLWGVLVHDRSNTGLARVGYRPFVTWSPLDHERAFEVFSTFWKWLRDLRADVERGGFTLRAYAWHKSAEETQMRAATTGTALRDEVDAWFETDEWIDLKRVFEAGWTHGGSNTLKVVAPLVGHTWEVDDPGGDRSISQHRKAISEAGDEAHSARRWLLDYNRGDVEATARIRHWLSTQGPHCPPIPEP